MNELRRRVFIGIASATLLSLSGCIISGCAALGSARSEGGSDAAWKEIAEGAPVRVAVYVGPGARGVGMFRWTQLVDQAPELEAVYVDGAAIRAGALRGVDMVVMPGGKSNLEADELGPEGQVELRSFIERGGSYIGTCAGAFLVMGGEKPEKKKLGIVPFKHLSGSWGGEAMLQVEYTKDAEKMCGIKAGKRVERFNGGPVMQPGKPIPGADFKVMSTFDCNLHSYSSKTNMPSMGGCASAVAGTFGRGRVWIFAGHPEYFPRTWPSLKAAFKFVTGRDVTLTAPQRKMGQLAVGWWCKPGMGIESAELARMLVRGDDCDVVPYSNLELSRTALTHVDVLVVPDTPETNIVKKLAGNKETMALVKSFMDRGGKVVTWGRSAKYFDKHANLIVADASGSVLGILRSIKDAPLPPPRRDPPPKRAKPVRVAEYYDSGASGAAALRWAKLLSLSPDSEYIAIDGADVRNGVLKNVDLYVAPGGNANAQASKLGPQGLTNLVDFIRGGGKYIGTCAGCYLAMTLSEKDSPKARRLNLVPYRAQKTPYRGGAELDIKFTEHAHMFGMKPNAKRTVRYHGGPVLIPYKKTPEADIRPIATYACDGVYSYDTLTKPTMAGTPAIVAGTFGKGRVVAISPHPESYVHTQDIIRGGLFFLSGRPFDVEYPQRTRGNRSVGFLASNIRKDGAMLAVQLFREPSIDLRATATEDINFGALEHCDALIMCHPDKDSFTRRIRDFAKNGGQLVLFGSEKELAKVPADLPNVVKCTDAESVKKFFE